MNRNPQPRAAPATLASSAVQPDPAAHSAWIRHIRELRLAGHTLDEARAIAGPMPERRHTDAELDTIAGKIAFGVLLACIAELGPTRRAWAAAYAAIALTDAIEDEGSADARTVRDH